MRSADYINNLWQVGGPFTGEEGKPHTRVYVQDPWDAGEPGVYPGDEDHVIQPNVTNTGYKSRGLPVRWYQKQDNSQNMRQVPNVLTVNIDRSIDTDAATCEVVIKNQWMYDNGEVPEGHEEQGNRQLAGYFSPGWGSTPDAQARWGQQANAWENTFVPNTIVRTYQGYGGHSKSLEDCLLDGNLVLTGVWLIDEVKVSTDFNLNIRCRDMAKLLIDQQLFPPLIPSSKYPLTYVRYVYDNFKVKAAVKKSTTSKTVNVTKGNKRCVFRDSEVDHWYPQGSPGSSIASGGYTLHGHKGAHSIDGKDDTYYLGVGNNGPDRNFSVMWIEYACGEYIDTVYMKPWAGNYQMYISIYENGKWQGESAVPYSESELYGNQPYVVDTGADIKYVKKYGVPWEKGQEYKLPRYYKADRVRISFRHLTYSGIGQWMYRGGIRELRLRSSQAKSISIGTTATTIVPYFQAAANIRNPDDLNSWGYVTASQLNQIDAFGDCRTYSRNSNSNAPSNANVFWISLNRAGNGYWVLQNDGRVQSYGAAQFYGSPYSSGVGQTGGGSSETGWWQAIVPTPTGLGYWCVAIDGRIRAYGDAVGHGVPSVVPGFTYSHKVRWIDRKSVV